MTTRVYAPTGLESFTFAGKTYTPDQRTSAEVRFDLPDDVAAEMVRGIYMDAENFKGSGEPGPG